ncbi:MAG: transposase [Deltaproteobacteria bacterium]|nr:transposase [Deltaproteobacteria bacterium]
MPKRVPRCRNCPKCGHDDVVCSFSKGRGPCTSCSARAMGDGAAHLCDHVLPCVPYRQWVVSYPFQMNGALAFKPDLLAAGERMVTDALCRWQKARADDDDGKPGGVLVRQRFGGSLNLHVHAHLLVMDGVYRRNAGGALVFVRAPEPTPDELSALAASIRRRMDTLFKRRGLIRQDDDTGNLPEQLDALGAWRWARKSGNARGPRYRWWTMWSTRAAAWWGRRTG